MKLKNIILALYGVVCLVSTAIAEERSPSAFLPEHTFKFEPVIEGTEVKHDFILQNKGNETLIIESIKSG